MLLAELHGKRFPDAEGQEDWLTSAIFGNLRHVPPSLFWKELFDRALNTHIPSTSLTSALDRLGVSFASFTEFRTVFWKNCWNYGEPDLILRFTGPNVPPLIVLIEVKLNSTKSGTGDNDQLARYLALLDDHTALPEWRCAEDHRFIVYLTRAYARQEIEESISASRKPHADIRIFGLEWRDVLETAAQNSQSNPLLAEVAGFLKGRGFEAFRGFRHSPIPTSWPKGTFYGSDYFTYKAGSLSGNLNGRFYEQ